MTRFPTTLKLQESRHRVESVVHTFCSLVVRTASGHMTEGSGSTREYTLVLRVDVRRSFEQWNRDVIQNGQGLRAPISSLETFSFKKSCEALQKMIICILSNPQRALHCCDCFIDSVLPVLQLTPRQQSVAVGIQHAIVRCFKRLVDAVENVLTLVVEALSEPYPCESLESGITELAS